MPLLGGNGLIGAYSGANVFALIPDYITSETETDYSALSGDLGFYGVTGTLTWPDTSSGHIDGVRYSSSGDLVYYTASHEDTGTIYVYSPDEGILESYSPDYFIDSTAGGGGDGSLGSPYNEIGDLPSLTGDEIIAIASDSSLSDATLSLAAGCKVFRYGPGDKPIIDCGVTFTPGSWSATGGTTNVYQQTVSIYLHPSTSWVNVLEDGSHLTYVADTATCDSTAGSYTVSAYTGTEGDNSVTVYIHPTGSTDPTSDGNTYRYSRHYSGAYASNVAGVVVDGINTRLQTSNDGSIVVGQNSAIRHCLAEYGGKHNLLAGDGSKVLGTRAENAYYNSNATMIVVFESTGGNRDFLIGEFSCDRPDNDHDSNIDGIFSHTGSGTLGDSTIRRCHIKKVQDAATAYGVLSYTNQRSIFLDVNTVCSILGIGYTVEDCQYRQVSGGTGRGFTVNSASSPSYFRRLYMRVNPSTSGHIYSSTASVNVTVEDCQMLPVTGNSRGVYLTGEDVVVSVDGCQFGGSSVWTQRIFVSKASATLTSDNNVFEDENNTFAQYAATNYNTLALWQAQGFDLNSSLGSADVSKVPSA